jgi:hypothetical protein
VWLKDAPNGKLSVRRGLVGFSEGGRGVACNTDATQFARLRVAIVQPGIWEKNLTRALGESSLKIMRNPPSDSAADFAPRGNMTSS